MNSSPMVGWMVESDLFHFSFGVVLTQFAIFNSLDSEDLWAFWILNHSFDVVPHFDILLPVYYLFDGSDVCFVLFLLCHKIEGK